VVAADLAEVVVGPLFQLLLALEVEAVDLFYWMRMVADLVPAVLSLFARVRHSRFRTAGSLVAPSSAGRDINMAKPSARASSLLAR
jgi:hypothetical protein